ncbi:MAG: C4-dicarboxylic acid transporter DauA [Deltaproteobacteria bacterium]|nr:C4-dicarboxylic acid transporter DauA [Deltaproteobacteria bacterium]
MTPRYSQIGKSIKSSLFFSLKKTFQEGYSSQHFRSDVMAGIIVGMVAMPLGMALAIASGVAPQYGLYTIITAGFIVAVLGGSRFQVTGPTAAFVVVLVPIVQKFGLAGLLLSGMMAGVFLVVMGATRMGKLIQFIPYPVTTGFTAGIALTIAVLQLKGFFGITLENEPHRFHQNLIALIQARHTWVPTEFIIGMVTLFILLFWPKLNKKIPAPLVALTLMTVFTVLIKKYYPHIQFETIQSKFNGIPHELPQFKLPWEYAGLSKVSFTLNLKTIEALIPSAFAIAMLGAIESLLSAVIADGMTQTKHDSDAELIALGVGNIVCPFFGGIAATGAIARTATNIRFGAKSPISSIIHAIFVLITVLIFAPYISYLPMATLAALLLLVAYNISEIKHALHIIRIAPKHDVLILMMCFSLTAFFGIVTGVTVGIVLAALLFMKRMADITSAHALMGEHHRHIVHDFPKEVFIYEIAGPLFFGAAEKAMGSIQAIGEQVRIIVFIMNQVPIMDMTGLVAFESTLKKAMASGKMTFLVGVQEQPLELLHKSSILKETEKIHVLESLHIAREKAAKLLAA